MATIDLKSRSAARAIPPAKRSFWQSLTGKRPEAIIEQEIIPKGVDLSALWEEPEQGGGSLPTILGVANTALLVVLLALKFFGK